MQTPHEGDIREYVYDDGVWIGWKIKTSGGVLEFVPRPAEVIQAECMAYALDTDDPTILQQVIRVGSLNVADVTKAKEERRRKTAEFNRLAVEAIKAMPKTNKGSADHV